MPADLATVGRIEAATLATWPALTTRRDGSWVLRRSEGQTGRANSITILDPADDADRAQRLAEASRFYREAGLTPLLRATPLTPRTVVADLNAADDFRAGDTLVMTRALSDRAPAVAGVACEPRVGREWLATTAALMGFSDARRNAIGRKLATLATPAGFFTIRDDAGRAVATALAVAADGMLALFDIAVDPAFRRQGFGQGIVAAAFAWGQEAGAREAFLQVVADNFPAVSLYRRLGFGDAYRYRYLSLPDGAAP